MLELELFLLRPRAENNLLPFPEDDLEGGKGRGGLPVIGPLPFDPFDKRDGTGDNAPLLPFGLRVVSSMGIFLYEIESLVNVNGSPFDVKVAADEAVCVRAKDE